MFSLDCNKLNMQLTQLSSSKLFLDNISEKETIKFAGEETQEY